MNSIATNETCHCGHTLKLQAEEKRVDSEAGWFLFWGMGKKNLAALRCVCDGCGAYI